MARGHWGLLREALGHLAWSAADQIEWLGSVMLPDELALDFDKVYGSTSEITASTKLAERGWARGRSLGSHR